jgi:transcriptional regulator with AAA-type ATPase domain
VEALNTRAESLADELRDRLARGTKPKPEERQLYEDVVLYLLYNRVLTDLSRLAVEPARATSRVHAYARFAHDLGHYLEVVPPAPTADEAAHLFALFFQIRRAFHFTFTNILGGSLPAARLRAAVWQSIFSRDLRRYRRALYGRMHDVTTLIAGPSGSGKELVAQAIGCSQYIAFNPREQTFAQDFSHTFFPLNVSALPSTLVESELFGHRRGAFTGAVQDRPGWLETCPPESQERRFRGKLIAATNRDLAEEIEAGRFRADFYYRLCADTIETPSLQAQLRDAPAGELGRLVRFLAARIVGEEEADALADETDRWISARLAPDYPWPGNVRELEQCVRNVMIRGEYHPRRSTPRTLDAELAAPFLDGTLSADELLRRYCTLVFAKTGSYQETARRIGLDRRTVKDRVDASLLARLRGQSVSEDE